MPYAALYSSTKCLIASEDTSFRGHESRPENACLVASEDTAGTAAEPCCCVKPTLFVSPQAACVTNPRCLCHPKLRV